MPALQEHPAIAVVPTFMREPADLEVLMDLLVSIRATQPELDVLIVDDGSPNQGLVDELEAAKPRFEFDVERKPDNEGFSMTVNYGLRRALEEGKDAVLINADIELIDEGWLGLMQRQRTQDGEMNAAVVGARLLYPSGQIQHGGVFFSLLSRVFAHRYQFGPHDLPEANVASVCPVTAALHLIRHETLTRVGVYDEAFRMAHEDVDFCLRVFAAGGECVYQPEVRAYHYESMFRGRPSPKIQEWQMQSWAYFCRKHAKTGFGQWVPRIA